MIFFITLGPIKAIVIIVGCIIGAVLVIVVAVLAIAGVLTCCKRNRKKKQCKCYEELSIHVQCSSGI